MTGGSTLAKGRSSKGAQAPTAPTPGSDAGAAPPTTQSPTGAPRVINDMDITTVKAYQRDAQVIRQIGSLAKLNQEDVVALFRDAMEDHLLRLATQKVEEIQSRRPKA
jgi:hypothetical protein